MKRTQSLEPIGCRWHQLLVMTVTVLVTLTLSSEGHPQPPEHLAGIREEEPAVTRFREYLRINTAHPTPDYERAIHWLQAQAESIGLDFHIVRFDEPNLFATWMTWNGSEPDLPSILLNSHMDVVAADSAKWHHDPFAADMDEEGNIYARGAVDMKGSTVAQLEALALLKAQGFIPRRTIHLSVIPDEELGGERGMVQFLNSPEFLAMNVGLDIDEAGSAAGSDTMFIVHAEKSIWQFNISVTGVGGHGSSLRRRTASEKLQIVINRMMAFRESQLDLLEQPNITMADVTSLNMVGTGGWLGHNIIPDELWASFDMRIRPTSMWNFTHAQDMLGELMQEVGEGGKLQFITKAVDYIETPIDGSNIWWGRLQQTCEQLKVTCRPDVFSGGTDGGYVREKGIPVLGINPFLGTPWVAHEINEVINEYEFLSGIDRYFAIIRDLSLI